MRRILIIDDDRDIRLLLDRFLSKKGFVTEAAGSRSSALAKFKEQSFDLVITDYKLPDGDGLAISAELKKLGTGVPIIMITAYSDVKMAVKAVKRGIFDYITKPLHPDELLETIDRALNSPKALPVEKVKLTVEAKTENKGNADYVAGNSKAALKAMEQIELIAPTNMSVVLLGETGSGKEFAAKEIHARSKRKDGPFVAIDCGALPDEIAGSELFGHVKGAFTGALRDKIGSFEHADRGTIFLDEIGNLKLEHQVKLLRLLQESKIKRLGSNVETEIDVRLIVATNDDLLSRSMDGDFRKDLYYRLNEFTINLPALRDREEDVLLFANYFIQKANRSLGRNVKAIGKKARKRLMQYTWPGNLRELRNVIKRAVLLSKGETIKMDSLPSEIKMPESYFLQKSSGIDDDLKSASLQAEHDTIMDALRKTGNNKSKAAEMLNIDRKTLYNKLKQFETEL